MKNVEIPPPPPASGVRETWAMKAAFGKELLCNTYKLVWRERGIPAASNTVSTPYQHRINTLNRPYQHCINSVSTPYMYMAVANLAASALCTRPGERQERAFMRAIAHEAPSVLQEAESMP